MCDISWETAVTHDSEGQQRGGGHHILARAFACSERRVVYSELVVRGGIEPADLPLFRRIRRVASHRWAAPDGQSSCGNHGSSPPDVAWRLSALAPPISLAPLTFGNLDRLADRGAIYAGAAPGIHGARAYPPGRGLAGGLLCLRDPADHALW